ncbi:MAG: hypothetical protein D6732_00265 [Methanobacteriota archaeon]|nr:MAG: hypothetical protein D6732_00265 [Euryarchaeota archaeon]
MSIFVVKYVIFFSTLMEDVKALFYFEVGYLAVYLQKKLTFRETAMKSSMSWPLVLLFVDTYKDYQQFMTPEMQEAAKNIEQVMLSEKGMQYNDFRIHPYRYMNLFGTWGPPEWDYIGGMFATYWKKGSRCGLKDISFGDKPARVILDLSCREFFHFVTNWLISHHWWIIDELNLDEILNSGRDNTEIPDFEIKSWHAGYETQLREYLIHYLLDIHDRLLKNEISLDWLLSLDGIYLIGALLASEKLREKYGQFFKDLLENRNTLPRGWRAVLAIILETIIYPDYPRFSYDRLKELSLPDAEPYKKWIKELECDDFRIFEEYDHYLNNLKLH